MSPPKTVTRERILDGALAALRREGSRVLNARALARELHCSTQPLYASFGSMEEIRSALLDRAKEICGQYLVRFPRPTLFGTQATGFLRFAAEEPQLFRFIYVETPRREGPGERAYRDGVIESIRAAGNYSREGAERFYALTDCFLQGLALRILAAPGEMTPEVTDRLLGDAFGAFKQYLGGDANA